MGSMSTSDVVQLFKKVYGGLNDVQPGDFKLQKMLPFTEKQRVGDSYIEAVTLTAEAGITLGGTGTDAFDIQPAVAGSVKQATVSPYTSVLASVMPWGVMARSAGGGEAAFYDGTKWLVRNHLKSHNKWREVMNWYGGSTNKLGAISYATATYRGVALTTGTGTVNGTAFTNGINAASKKILMAPGEWAAGIWVGSEGLAIEEIATATSTVVATGKVVSVDSEYGILEVDFTPIAASGVASHALGFVGMAAGKDQIGVAKILGTTSGNLFGVPVANYSLWKGITLALSAELFKFSSMSKGIALAVNRGGLGGDGDGSLDVFINPRTWSTLLTTEVGKRVFDKSYSTKESEEGSESISFFSENGKVTIHSYRMIKEGYAFGMHMADWSRSGSQDVAFKVANGIGLSDVIYPLENQAGYAFRSMADLYLFNNAPARSIMWTGVNDESAT